MLLGPAPGLENYWCCCGSHVGIAWGPGAGKYLAQWMVKGTADINMRDFDPRRFGNWIDRDYEIGRAKEDYVLRHEIPYPGRQRDHGRPKKTSAVDQRLRDAGAVHEEIYGWERPRWFPLSDQQPNQDVYAFKRPDWYRAVAEECKAVRERVGVMDLTGFAKIDILGGAAEDFLNRMVANRAPRKDGGIVLTHILNQAGTIEAEITIARFSESHFYVMCAAFSEQKVADWLNHHRNEGEDVRAEIVSADLGVLVLSGPRSRDVMKEVTDESLDNKSWPWLRGKSIRLAGVDNVRALRMSYQGELGWELHVPMSGMAQAYDALWAAGEPHDIANFGSYTLNSLRLEKGFKGASELTNEVTLPEADVMRFCKLDKGDFIGRQATMDSADSRLRWICVYLEIDANDCDAHASETVFHQGRRVGQVSSGGYGFSTNKSLAFAYVDPAVSAPGTELEVMIMAEKRPAVVLADAVYDPENLLPRQDA